MVSTSASTAPRPSGATRDSTSTWSTSTSTGFSSALSASEYLHRDLQNLYCQVVWSCLLSLSSCNHGIKLLPSPLYTVMLHWPRGAQTGGKSTWPSKTQKIAMMHKMSFCVWWKEATYSIWGLLMPQNAKLCLNFEFAAQFCSFTCQSEFPGDPDLH